MIHTCLYDQVMSTNGYLEQYTVWTLISTSAVSSLCACIIAHKLYDSLKESRKTKVVLLFNKKLSMNFMRGFPFIDQPMAIPINYVEVYREVKCGYFKQNSSKSIKLILSKKVMHINIFISLLCVFLGKLFNLVLNIQANYRS